MIKLKMKLSGAIIPQAGGAVLVTLVQSDEGEGGAKAIAPVNLQILDAELAGRLSLDDELEITIAPAGELRADAWRREQAEKNPPPAFPASEEPAAN